MLLVRLLSVYTVTLLLVWSPLTANTVGVLNVPPGFHDSPIIVTPPPYASELVLKVYAIVDMSLISQSISHGVLSNT